MTESPIIREVAPDDAQALVTFVEALVAENTGTVTLRIAPTLEQEHAFIARIAAMERAFVLAAVDGARIVGMLDLQAGERDFNRHTARFGMSVARDHRGRGVGHRLLETAIARTQAWPGFCRIELEVMPHNTAAIRLYERLGFVLEARKAKAVRVGDQPTDLLLMALVW